MAPGSTPRKSAAGPGSARGKATNEPIVIDDSSSDDDRPDLGAVALQAIASSQERRATSHSVSLSPVKRPSGIAIDLTLDSDDEAPVFARSASSSSAQRKSKTLSPTKQPHTPSARAGPGPSTSANRAHARSASRGAEASRSRPDSSDRSSAVPASTSRPASRPRSLAAADDDSSDIEARDTAASTSVKRSSQRSAQRGHTVPDAAAEEIPPLGSWQNPEPLIPTLRIRANPAAGSTGPPPTVKSESKSESPTKEVAPNSPDPLELSAECHRPEELQQVHERLKSQESQSPALLPSPSQPSRPTWATQARQNTSRSPEKINVALSPLPPVHKPVAPTTSGSPTLAPHADTDDLPPALDGYDADASAPDVPPGGSDEADISFGQEAAGPASTELRIPEGSWGNPVQLQPSCGIATGRMETAPPTINPQATSAALLPPANSTGPVSDPLASQAANAVGQSSVPSFVQASETSTLAVTPPPVSSPPQMLPALSSEAIVPVEDIPGVQQALPDLATRPLFEPSSPRSHNLTPASGTWGNLIPLIPPNTALTSSSSASEGPAPAPGTWGNAIPLITTRTTSIARPNKRPATPPSVNEGEEQRALVGRPAKTRRVISPSSADLNETVSLAPPVDPPVVLARRPAPPGRPRWVVSSPNLPPGVPSESVPAALSLTGASPANRTDLTAQSAPQAQLGGTRASSDDPLMLDSSTPQVRMTEGEYAEAKSDLGFENAIRIDTTVEQPAAAQVDLADSGHLSRKAQTGFDEGALRRATFSDDLLALRPDIEREDAKRQAGDARVGRTSADVSRPTEATASLSQLGSEMHHERKGDTDPLALDAGSSGSPRRSGVAAVKTEIAEGQDGAVDIAPALRNVSCRASPALSTGSSIQEVTFEEFNRAVPAFKSARPEGMSALEYLRSKRRAGQAEGCTPASPKVISAPAGRETTPVPQPRPIMIDDPKTKASRAEWRRIVDEDGASDFEMLLDADEESHSSSASMNDVERDLQQRQLNDPTQIPPPDRRGAARRHFDSSVVDEWNALYENLSKKPALHRMIVSSYFHSKEPDSSEIPIHNEVDSEGVPPELEFEYSNDMLYGPDVPDPEKGLGCGCEGPCDENSTTCSCLKRQQLYFYELENLRGFAYRPDGTVKNLTTPIWECSETCGCPPSCMNRVIQRGRAKETKIELIKTRQKGWGIRTAVKIPKGTFIGVYAGELISEECSELRGQLYTEIGRTYIFDLDGWQISNPPPGLRKVDPRLAETAEAAARRARRISGTHGAVGLYNAYSVDAFHYGNVTRFFNHSCDPNLETTQAYVKDFHPERPLMVIFARRDIRAKEELCISYKGTPDDDAEEVLVETKKGKKRQSKTSTAAHITTRTTNAPNEIQKMKNRCFCGSANCDGKMFNMN